MEIPKSLKCRICSKESNAMKRCTRCHTVYYCSRECQVVDWSTHKTECNRDPTDPVKEHDQAGRRDVSTSNISASTVLSAPHSRGTVDSDTPANQGNVHHSGGRNLATTKSANTVDFQKAFDEIKKPHRNSTETLCNSKRGSYVNRNTVMHDLPRSEAGQRTFTITVKGNKRKDRIQLQEGWQGEDVMKMISHTTTVPLDKMKLIHRGRVVTAENINLVAQDKAVLQVIGEPSASSEGIDPRDIDVLMKQLSVGRNEAVRALRDKGDVVDAILYLSNK